MGKKKELKIPKTFSIYKLDITQPHNTATFGFLETMDTAMRTFPLKGALKKATEEADKIKRTIDLTTDLHKVLISFFQYVHCNVPNAPSNGTGRKYPLKSLMAEEIFGKTLSALLYSILNKFANNASGKNTFEHNFSFFFFIFFSSFHPFSNIGNCGRSNNDILAFFLNKFNMYLRHFLSEQAAGPNGLSQSEENDKDALELYIDEQMSNLTPRIYVWWIKFLVCEVDVKKQGKSRSTRSSSILKNFKANLDKKISDFMKKVVADILKGKTTLVDRALVDLNAVHWYNQRQPLRKDSKIDTKHTYVSLFHSKSDGTSLATRDACLSIGDTTSKIFKTTMGERKYIPFMGIYFETSDSGKGGARLLPKWHGGTNFLTTLKTSVITQLRILEASSVELKERLILEFQKCDNNDLPHDLSDKYPDNIKGFVETGDIMIQEPAFSFKKFFCAWDDNFLHTYFDNDVATSPHKEQPALSMKLGWLQVQLHCLLSHLVRDNIETLSFPPPTYRLCSYLRFFPVQ